MSIENTKELMNLIAYTRWDTICWSRVIELIHLGVDVNTKDYNGFTPLLSALSSEKFDIRRKEIIDIIRTLLELGADPNIPDKWGDSPLIWAIRECTQMIEDFYIELIKLLIEYNVDLNYKNKIGQTALIISVKKNLCDITRLLLLQKNIDGKSALNYIDSLDMTKVFREYGFGIII